MKILEICNYLEQIAPLSLQESYDNSGLLVGDKNWDIKGVLTTLDCTEDVIDEAIKKGCNLIVAHHPIVFTGLKRIIGKNYVERVIIKAIKHDIAIYAAHTPFDNVLKNGVNQFLGNLLQLSHIQILQPKAQQLIKLVTFCPVAHTSNVLEALFGAGMGKIGNYDSCSFKVSGQGSFRALDGANPFIGELNRIHYENEDRIEGVFPLHLQDAVVKTLKEVHPYEEVAYDLYLLQNSNSLIGSGVIGELEEELSCEEFLQKLKKSLDLKQVRYTSVPPNHKIKKVALCGGSGSFLLKSALAAGADAYVTADIKYHEFFDAENRMLTADIGHYETEKHTKQLFFEILSKKFSNFALYLSETNTNPVNYF